MFGDARAASRRSGEHEDVFDSSTYMTAASWAAVPGNCQPRMHSLCKWLPHARARSAAAEMVGYRTILFSDNGMSGDLAAKTNIADPR